MLEKKIEGIQNLTGLLPCCLLICVIVEKSNSVFAYNSFACDLTFLSERF